MDLMLDARYGKYPRRAFPLLIVLLGLRQLILHLL
jgi:hypothetical protein